MYLPINISQYQKLSETFIERYKDKVDKSLIPNQRDTRIYERKLKSIQKYAKKHNLRFEDGKLYAYRNHDIHGRGMFNRTYRYESGKYYRDWKCDLDPNNINSYGLGIFPKGNTMVVVTVNDWGVEVNNNNNNSGKGRVWGFTVV